MRRRSFLVGAGAALAASSASAQVPARKLERLSLSTSSYRANYDGWRYAVETAQPRLSHLTFPAYTRDRFGMRKVELWDQQFGPDGHTPENCRKVRAAADAAGVSIVNIEVEDLPNLGQADPVARAAALTALKAWLDKGRILGAGSIRVNVSRGDAPVDRGAAIETLRAGADYGRAIGVKVLLENHGGYTAKIPDLVSLVKAVDHDHCRIEIDWGAWNPPGDRYADIRAAMPYVHIVSAKGEIFDEATYAHTPFDVGRLVREAEADGFKGLYSIELWSQQPPKDTDRAVRSYMETITAHMR